MYSCSRHIFSVCVLSAALCGGYVFAGERPPDSTPQDSPQAKPAVKLETDSSLKEKPRVEPKAKAEVQSQDSLKRKAKLAQKARAKRAASAKKSGRKPQFKMNPDAKWACDQQTVELEPVWRGGKTLTFSFNIRNEGTADLKIKARGG